MKNTNKITLISLLALQGTAISSCSQEKEEKLPNIVILMTDDMGYLDISCYGSDIQTPNIDRIAEQGMRFTDFYAAAPNCSPSRAGLLTGRSPSRIGVYDWIPSYSPMHLPEEEITIAEILKTKDYATCHVGKWHLSKWDNEAGILDPKPDKYGFDYWFAVDNNAVPSHLNPINFQRNGEKVGPLEGYSSHLVVEEGIKWLNERENKDQPFFLNIWFNEPHHKLASPEELIAKHPELDPQEALYYANIENVDLAVGKILDALDDMGVADNTFILFTSDNGPWRNASAGNFRGKKSSLYEGGIREPGILKWPGHIAPGTQTSVPAGFVDILPTICEMTGAALPQGKHLDGASILPILNQEVFIREQPLFWFFYKSSPTMGLRKGDYILTADPNVLYRSKSHPFDQTDQDYLKSLTLESFQLYNIKEDIGQKNDLSQEEPEILDELKAELLSIHKSMIAEGTLWEGLKSDLEN